MNDVWIFKPEYPVYEINGNELYPVTDVFLEYESFIKDYPPDYFIIDDRYLVYYDNEEVGKNRISELLFILNTVFGELKE